MKVSFYLARPVIIGEDGKPQVNPNPTVIYCRICYLGYKMKYFTPENILPKFWNSKIKPHRAKETTKFPEHPEFNKRLDNIESDIKNSIRKYANDNGGIYPTPNQLKPLLDLAIKNGGKIEKMTFLKYFNDYMERCKAGGVTNYKTKKPLSGNTLKAYKTTYNMIEKYITDTRKPVDFETINMDFYNHFNDYLAKKQDQSLNSIGKHTKIIKTILTAATENGFNTNLAFQSRGFVTASEEADTIYLADWELKEIANLDLSEDKKLDVVRDLFLIGCNTGLRFSDLSTLTPAQIKDGMITITQIKTGKPVVIPVSEMVTKIMKKYNGKLPEARSNQKMNEYLKDVCKAEKVKSLKSLVSITKTKGGGIVTETVPKWKLVSTHTARRSFATNEYLAGTPSLTIMAITGHKTEKSFLKYIKVTPDQHAKILQGIWADRKENEGKRIAI